MNDIKDEDKIKILLLKPFICGNCWCAFEFDKNNGKKISDLQFIARCPNCESTVTREIELGR